MGDQRVDSRSPWRGRLPGVTYEARPGCRDDDVVRRPSTMWRRYFSPLVGIAASRHHRL